MMQKYGVENVNNHFMAFNTICDATQVIFPFPTFPSALHNTKSCSPTQLSLLLLDVTWNIPKCMVSWWFQKLVVSVSS